MKLEEVPTTLLIHWGALGEIWWGVGAVKAFIPLKFIMWE